ncbi:MAG TPA: transcription elongation factor NusA [Candidatus Methanofastidiosa archaeon]|nr:transcription elongation factor NusA [Candidatus Methanofastidiosa archaeon]HPR41542.1 transcription elongation factor NusA [Candidatus Methanofastidiosa archaeon]
MRTPICEICLKSGILCPGCQEKLASGEISQLDVDMSKLLYRIVNQYNVPKDFRFVKAYEFEDLIVLIVGKDDVGAIVGKGGKILKILQKEFHNKIRVIEDTNDIRKMAEDLLFPARIVGVNIIFLPEGKRKRIRISQEDTKRLPIELKAAEGIIKALTGEDITITVD